MLKPSLVSITLQIWKKKNKIFLEIHFQNLNSYLFIFRRMLLESMLHQNKGIDPGGTQGCRNQGIYPRKEANRISKRGHSRAASSRQLHPKGERWGGFGRDFFKTVKLFQA